MQSVGVDVHLDDFHFVAGRLSKIPALRPTGSLVSQARMVLQILWRSGFVPLSTDHSTEACKSTKRNSNGSFV
jgi:hypothetical protein